MVKQPLPAKAGERVRLHVLNVGPSKTSSFHVVGTIFDRVWIDGNPNNQFRGINRRARCHRAEPATDSAFQPSLHNSGGCLSGD
jgi:hypothetical protein